MATRRELRRTGDVLTWEKHGERPQSSAPANRATTRTYARGDGFNGRVRAVAPDTYGVVPGGAVQTSLPGTRSGNWPSGLTRARTMAFPGMNR